MHRNTLALGARTVKRRGSKGHRREEMQSTSASCGGFGKSRPSRGDGIGRLLIGSLLSVTLLGGTLARTADPPVSSVRDLGSGRPGQDWPSFLGPAGDNKSNETGFVFPWPPAGPSLRWSRKLGESYGIGSLSRGRYLQFDYVEGQASLVCVTSETGEELWRFSYASDYADLYNYSPGPRTTPVIDDDRVYIFGVEGILHCLRVEDGTLVWKVDTQEKFGVVQNFFGVGSTPAIFDELLVVIVGGSPPEDQLLPPGRLDRVRGNGSGVVAFHKRTGEVAYQLSDELASYASPRIVRRPDRSWAFCFTRGGLLAFDPSNGRQDFFFPWRARTLESVNASTPTVWKDRVFISETYGPGAALLTFRPGGYELVWTDDLQRRAKAMQAHWNTPIYHEGYLYGSSGRHAQNAELRCLDAETGRTMWSQPGLARSSLLYVDGHFICLSEDGTLRVIRATPERYELVSEFMPREEGIPGASGRPLLTYPAWAAPLVSHGLLYVRGKDRLLCYELPRRGE